MQMTQKKSVRPEGKHFSVFLVKFSCFCLAFRCGPPLTRLKPALSQSGSSCSRASVRRQQPPHPTISHRVPNGLPHRFFESTIPFTPQKKDPLFIRTFKNIRTHFPQ